MRTDSPQLYRQLSVIVIVMCCCYCYWYDGDWRELHPDMVTSRLRWLAGRRPGSDGEAAASPRCQGEMLQPHSNRLSQPPPPHTRGGPQYLTSPPPPHTRGGSSISYINFSNRIINQCQLIPQKSICPSFQLNCV